MTKYLSVVATLVLLIGSAFAALEYLDNRYTRPSSTADLPNGTIVAWYAESGNIPNGWVVCDGTNGTPDLRNKFLRGGSSIGDLKHHGGKDVFTIPERDIRVFAAGWDNAMSESPNGGPEEHQSWRSRRWHRLISKGKIQEEKIEILPPYQTVVFIMKKQSDSSDIK